jgi:hypothetical protein
MKAVDALSSEACLTLGQRYDDLPVPEEQSHELLGCGVEEALTS